LSSASVEDFSLLLALFSEQLNARTFNGSG